MIIRFQWDGKEAYDVRGYEMSLNNTQEHPDACQPGTINVEVYMPSGKKDPGADFFDLALEQASKRNKGHIAIREKKDTSPVQMIEFTDAYVQNIETGGNETNDKIWLRCQIVSPDISISKKKFRNEFVGELLENKG